MMMTLRFLQRILLISMVAFAVIKICLFSSFATVRSKEKVVREFSINPFIGTSGEGHTNPGAKYPFGMIYIGPVSSTSDHINYSAGYQHSDKKLYGVAHNFLSGTGVRLGTDFVVKTSMHPAAITSEVATAGYYGVETEYASSEFVAGLRYGVHRYKFLRHNRLYFDDPVTLVRSPCVIESSRPVSNLFLKYTVHLHAEFSSECAVGDRRIDFNASEVEMKTAISYVDLSGARLNFDEESSSFDDLHARVRDEWNRVMSASYDRLRVDVGKIRNQRVFDTALYHMLLSPYVHSDADGRFLGPDRRIHQASTVYYSFISSWDVYRAWGPLMCIMMPNVMVGLTETGLLHHKITGNFPRWTFAGQETNFMPSMHSMTLVYQAIEFGLIDETQQMRVYAAFKDTVYSKIQGSSNAELHKIIKNGGILFANEEDTQTVSQMLEYAVVFECVSKLARRMNDSRVEQDFAKLSRVYQKLYDPSVGLYTGIDRTGKRIYDRAPTHSSNDGLFTEGNAMQWLFHVMHDIPGLIRVMGEATFRSRLDALFTVSGSSDVPDTTGLIGMYAQGNEPSHHVAFIYFLIGKPELGRSYVDKILSFYNDTHDGLCGNDDAGQLSAWYVAASQDFYPMNPTDRRMLKF